MSKGFATIVDGRFWLAKCWLVAVLATLMFATAPALFVSPDIELPPAYLLKAQSPFADTATLTIPEHPGERAHGAKLTPRLTGSVLLFISTQASAHPYLSATAFGLLFILAGILTGYRVSGDRRVGLYIGLIYAGLYASSASFGMNWMPKPFDGVAIGMAGLALLASTGRPYLLLIAAFLACWTDERALLSLLLIAAFVIVQPNNQPDRGNRLQRTRCLMIGIAVVSYLLSRLTLSSLLGWQSADLNMVGMEPSLAILFAPLAAWVSFEGGWIAIILALLVAAKSADYKSFWILLGSVITAISACLVVLDTSRVAAFAFPVIVIALAVLENYRSETELRRIFGAAAMVSLLAPNFEVIAGVTVKWLPPLLLILLLVFVA